jgi:hypothetical protein
MENNKGTFLTFLCVLTIIGSLFTILRGYLYELISTIDTDHSYFRGWIYILSSIGTAVGAILMLQKKFIGLIIYTVCQIIYLLTIVYATSQYANDSVSDFNFGALAVAISAFFLFPSLIVLVLYWLDINRKLLK